MTEILDGPGSSKITLDTEKFGGLCKNFGQFPEIEKSLPVPNKILATSKNAKIRNSKKVQPDLKQPCETTKVVEILSETEIHQAGTRKLSLEFQKRPVPVDWKNQARLLKIKIQWWKFDDPGRILTDSWIKNLLVDPEILASFHEIYRKNKISYFKLLKIPSR